MSADVGFGCMWEGGLQMLLYKVHGGKDPSVGAEMGYSCRMQMWGAGARCGVQMGGAGCRCGEGDVEAAAGYG